MSNKTGRGGRRADEPMPTLIRLARGAVGALVTQRPILGLGGPVYRVTTATEDELPVLRIEAATSVGLRELVVWHLSGSSGLRSILDQSGNDPDVAAVVTFATNDVTANAFRTLNRLAQLTSDADEFVARVIRAPGSAPVTGRSDPAKASRRLLKDLQGSHASAERLRFVYDQLRRLRVPRPAQLAHDARVWPDEPQAVARASALYATITRDWPASVTTDTTSDTHAPKQARPVFTAPGLGAPAEQVTRTGEIKTLVGMLADVQSHAWVAVVAGGGMGKSSLAGRLCHMLASRYSVVGWLTATNAATWTSSTKLLADRLDVPDDMLMEELLDRRPALVIIDDAPAPELLSSAVPSAPGLHVVVTSQLPEWRSAAEVLELDPLPDEEATEFLLARTGAQDAAVAREVAATLHGYPLALEQAAAAIVDGWSMPGWLRRQQDAATRHTSGLRATWELRIEGLRQHHPDALILLRLAACAGPTPVPVALLTGLGSAFGVPAPSVCTDAARFDAALKDLRRQSLVRTGVDTETVQVHAILAEFTLRDSDADTATLALLLADAAGRLLNEFDRQIRTTWSSAADLVGAAVAACRTLFAEAERQPGRFARSVLAEVSFHALWPAAGYLHEVGAVRNAYRVRLLALALHGDPAARAAVSGWSGEVSDAFSDLVREDIVPAAELGQVTAPIDRLRCSRWINENTTALLDVDPVIGEEYSARALTIVPRRLAEDDANPAELPRAVAVRIEILDSLGYAQIIRERYAAATETFNRAVRLRRRYPGALDDSKFAELLNDRALALLDAGLPLTGRRAVTQAIEIIHRTLGPDAAMLGNVENNLSIFDRQLWILRPAHDRLRRALELMWDRLDPRHTDVVIQQCNTGLSSYDLGETEEGWSLVEGSWRTLSDRLGPAHRETLIRRVALAELQLYRGDNATAHAGFTADLATYTGENESSPWAWILRVQLAWLTGVAALAPEVARRLAETTAAAWNHLGAHAALALQFHTANIVAGGSATKADARIAADAESLSAAAHGAEHPFTLLASARRALIDEDAGGDARLPLKRSRARRLLTVLDSSSEPGRKGFDQDLSRVGQPPLSQRHGWEADRLRHLLDDDVVDLSSGEQVAWSANGGRLAALAGIDEDNLLRDAAAASVTLWGPNHPWTLLRRAAAAVAADDREQLRTILTAPLVT
jgi:tetratricopeptide (TPR) repeat protein